MKHLIALLFICVSFMAEAQNFKATRVFDKGQWDIQGGVGVFQTYAADKAESIVLPLSLTARWMTTKNVSLGLTSGYSHSRTNRPNALCGSWYNQTYFLGLQTGFHYTKIDNLDLSGGFSLAYQHVKLDPHTSEKGNNGKLCGIKAQSGKLALSAFVETRYAFAPRYYVFANLGYGVSILKFGVGYKLG